MAMIGKEELNRICDDEDILALYCQILAKRLFIIDDKEFLGTKQALMGKFLSLDQIKFAAFTLNRVAFQVFRTDQTKTLFRQTFLADLRDVLSRLHNRGERNKLFPKDFWTIDRSMADGVENLNF